MKLPICTDGREFRFYPNPATTQLNVESYGEGDMIVRIVGMDGRILIEQRSTPRTTVDISSLAAGRTLWRLYKATNSGAQNG